MDRRGRVYTAEECKKELAEYKRTSKRYAGVNVRPEGMRIKMMQLHAQYIYKTAYLCKIARGVKRRLKRQ